MLMTAHVDVSIRESILTFNGGLGHHNALREQRQRLRSLEGRARRISLSDGHVHIVAVGGVRSEADNLARLRPNGHDASLLAFQQTFAQLLQHRSYGQWSVGRQSLRQPMSSCQHAQTLANDMFDDAIFHIPDHTFHFCGCKSNHFSGNTPTFYQNLVIFEISDGFNINGNEIEYRTSHAVGPDDSFICAVRTFLESVFSPRERCSNSLIQLFAYANIATL